MHKIHVKIFVAPEAKVCKLFPGAESFEIEVGRIWNKISNFFVSAFNPSGFTESNYCFIRNNL